jgi:hypothetical protein
MTKLAAIAAGALFAGCLCAQTDQPQTTQSRTTTTTQTTTWNGTLVDAACQNTRTERKEQTSDAERTTTKTTVTNSVDCPVTTSTTSFGLMTPEGQYVRFDDPSNTRVVEVVKKNRKWNSDMTEKQPIKVRVIGTPNGDVVVVKSIQ